REAADEHPEGLNCDRRRRSPLPQGRSMASEMFTRYHRLRLERGYGHHRAVRELGLQTGLDLETVGRVLRRARVVQEGSTPARRPPRAPRPLAPRSPGLSPCPRGARARARARPRRGEVGAPSDPRARRARDAHLDLPTTVGVTRRYRPARASGAPGAVAQGPE